MRWAMYNPFVRIVGVQQAPFTGTLDVVGVAPLVFLADAGMVYNSSTRALQFNGSQAVRSTPPFSLGTPSQSSAGSLVLATGFSVVVSVSPAVVPSDNVTLLWELTENHAGPTGLGSYVALRVTPPGYYSLAYKRHGLHSGLVAFDGPTAHPGVRVTLAVRCVPGMLLCTLIDLKS